MQARAVTRASPSPYDLYIVGTGIISPRQITPEVNAAIRNSTEVFYIDPNIGIAEYLRDLSPKITSLASAYEEGLDRGETYRRISARVFSAAIDHPPVTLALYGHPLVFALSPFHLMDLAGRCGLRVKVLPGISSLDTLFIDLKLDPAVNGLQVYEATDVVLRNRPLQSDVPCFILQIGTFGTVLFSTTPSAPQRFTPFKEHLSRFYPGDHQLYGVTSSGHPLILPTIFAFELQAMEEYASRLDSGVTLFIPAVSGRAISDDKLYAAMRDAEHLRTLLDLPSSNETVPQN